MALRDGYVHIISSQIKKNVSIYHTIYNDSPDKNPIRETNESCLINFARSGLQYKASMKFNKIEPIKQICVCLNFNT